MRSPLTKGGNLLGSARAEVDSDMLARAFVETADYRALTQSQDYNFIVGRRGTGKTALFRKVGEHFSRIPGTFLITGNPEEHQTMELQRLMGRFGDAYRAFRSITRLIWRTHILVEVLAAIRKNYRAAKAPDFAFLNSYAQDHRPIFAVGGAQRCIAILQHVVSHKEIELGLPAKIAQVMHLERLQQGVRSALQALNLQAIVLYDGLDEGWEPTAVATALVGGLTITAADLRDNQINIHIVLFIRDNIFRSLAQLDTDFTRHIEGHTLRLHWDESSLFRLVSKRLRVVFEFPEAENDVKVWNRFAQRELKDRSGFELCLHHTLYRPRDILVLLNDAYMNASRDNREAIVEPDVELAAKQISLNRLEDLLKEYEVVLPGLKLFVTLFEGRPSRATIGEIVDLLEREAQTSDFEVAEARDFALFGSGQAILEALFSVGFIGILDPTTSRIAFCHDGSASTINVNERNLLTAVHPCYWKALSLRSDTAPEELMVQINDEYKTKASAELRDQRLRRLGEIQGELPRLPQGQEASRDFESWVFRALGVLFAGKLTNIQRKPNPGAIQQRDIVATNMAEQGFWKRIRDDYRSRQVVFEAKNYEELGPDDFRQVLSYSSGEYGSFAIIVSRAPKEIPTETEKGWIKTMWYEHQRLILVLPAELLARCVSKQRSDRKYDYAEDALGKRMDLFVRSLLNLHHEKIFRRKKRK